MSDIKVPGVVWIIALVALVPPLSEWIAQWIPQPWAALIIILIGVAAKVAQVIIDYNKEQNSIVRSAATTATAIAASNEPVKDTRLQQILWG